MSWIWTAKDMWKELGTSDRSTYVYKDVEVGKHHEELQPAFAVTNWWRRAAQLLERLFFPLSLFWIFVL
jgi:hypothetical protein